MPILTKSMILREKGGSPETSRGEFLLAQSRLWGRTRDSGLGVCGARLALSVEIEHADREEVARCVCLTGVSPANRSLTANS